MLIIDPKETPTADFHQFLLAAVAPRPIAFASTIDENGEANLAPYSFFNAFSSNPPILIFSSNRTVANNTTKDTLHNVLKTKEVVINVVNYAIVRQMAIASISFPTGVSEFSKSGLTPIPSDLVKPFRVKESPVQMECRVQQIIELGQEGGAGNLIICEVLRMHIDEKIMDDKNNNRIDPHKIDLMGRLGRAYYCRASGDAIHTIVQSVMEISVGYDQLPKSIKSSVILTANDIARMAGLLSLPTEAQVEAMKNQGSVQAVLIEGVDVKNKLHTLAKAAIDEDQVDTAAQIAMVLDLSV